MRRPPDIPMDALFRDIARLDPEAQAAYMALHSPLDEQGRYLPFDELFYRFPESMDITLAWGIIKSARRQQQQSLMFPRPPLASASFMLTPLIQRTVSQADRYATTHALQGMSDKVGERERLGYLLEGLIEDEAISSSQLEGAATTLHVAKKMLRRNREPRTADERMILGNYKLMQHAWQVRDQPLSLAMICEFHRIAVAGIDDDQYRPGAFRDTDDVVVVDQDGDIVHQPPPAEGLEARLQSVCDWVNACHDDAQRPEYLHPLVKAVVLHFTIGFEHPFRDGNGRVARALFYWFMFKNEYAAFRYIAISVLLKRAATRYGKSYLYSETDGLDLTYFIEYQCEVIGRAIALFQENFQRVTRDIEECNAWLDRSGLNQRMSHRHQLVLQVARAGLANVFTITNVADRLGCSYNTAAKVLNDLVDYGLFRKRKAGREWLYSMRQRREIISDWRDVR